jgi:hypothetical protein
LQIGNFAEERFLVYLFAIDCRPFWLAEFHPLLKLLPAEFGRERKNTGSEEVEPPTVIIQSLSKIMHRDQIAGV